MDDAELEDLAKRFSGEATYVLGDLSKVEVLWANEATRPQAEELLKRWEDHGGQLRKAIATAWLARARKTLAGVVERAGAAAERTHTHGARSSAGGHPMPNPSNMAQPDTQPHVGPRIEAEEHAAPRLEAPKTGPVFQIKRRPVSITGTLGSLATAAAGYDAASAVRTHALSEKQREERRVAGRARWGKR